MAKSAASSFTSAAAMFSSRRSSLRVPGMGITLAAPVASTAETVYRWELERRGRALRVDVPCRLVVDGMRFAALAAKAGLGLAYVDEPWVADDLARGQLRVMVPQLAARASGLYLYYPQVSRRSPRVRALVEAARAR